MWDIFHKKNYGHFEHHECPVVALLNIYYFLKKKSGKKVIPLSQCSKEYKSLCKISYDCEEEELIKKIGLKIKKSYKTLYDFSHEYVKKGYMTEVKRKSKLELPFELYVYHKSYGLHVISIVQYEPITKSYRIPNFSLATNMEGWIYEEDLNTFARHTGKPVNVYELKNK